MDAARKNLIAIQSLVLFFGTIFAWAALFRQFSGTGPNPFLTACFYGSVAFLVALFWSVRVYQRPAFPGERRLRNFLLFCVVFAATVVAYEAVVFYKLFSVGTNAFICTPGVPPLETPCFTGLLFFTGALIVSVFATRRLPPV
jgi:hypothetical protein